MKTRRTFHYVRLLAVVASVVLFAWMVSRTRLATILDHTRLLGSGLVLLILLSGARHVLRAFAWRRCMKREDRNLGLLGLFGLRLVGEAITDIAPAGPLLGEPAKVLAASQYMPALASASSVLIENLTYGFAALLFMLSGVTLAVLGVATPRGFHWVGGGLILSLALSMLLAWLIISRRVLVLGGILDYLKKNKLKWTLLERYEQDLRALEGSIHNFFATRRSVLFFVLAIEFATNFTGVAEAYLILKATTAHASFLAAYLVESGSRAAQFAGVFVPFGLGVEEGAAALTLRAIGYSASQGVSLAIIRKIRTAFWAGIGLILAGRATSRTAGRRKWGVINHEATDCECG